MSDEDEAGVGPRTSLGPEAIALWAIGVGAIPLAIAWAIDRGRAWDAAQLGVVLATGIVIFWYTWETRLTRQTTEDSVQLAWSSMLRERNDARLLFDYAQFRLWRHLVTWTGQKYEDIDQRLDRWVRRIGRDGWQVHAERASALVNQLVALAAHLTPSERSALSRLVRSYLDGEERVTKAIGYLQDMPRNHARYTKRIHDAAGNIHDCLTMLHGDGAILSGWLSGSSDLGPTELLEEEEGIHPR